MEKVINLGKSKSDFVYNAAMSAAQSFASLLTLRTEGDINIDVDKNIFHKIFPNDPKSPAIHWIEEGKQYIIFYPSNSRPYNHNFKDKCKFVEVLRGVLYDANSDAKFFKGDKLKVTPKDTYAPYTESEECYLRVCIGDCNSVWDQICG